MAKSASSSNSNVNVYMWYPNLIGYARVVFLLAAIYVAFQDWKTCIGLYATSQLLDAFDGWAARKFDQCSNFGALLDMVTDRVSSSALLLILAILFPQYYMIFTGLFLLDFASHWVAMYAAASAPAGTQSHKEKAANAPWILRIYYTSKPVLFLVCASQELTYMSLYVIGQGTSSGLLEYAWLAFYASIPLTVFKQVANCIQLKDGCDEIVRRDIEARQKRK